MLNVKTRQIECESMYNCSNRNILITKPDKDSGVVVMDKKDYILEMEKILYDTTKFELIGPSCDFDNTTKFESKIQRQHLKILRQAGIPLLLSYRFSVGIPL